MIRQARADEVRLLSEIMNASLAIEGRQLQPSPTEEARASVADILAHAPELIDYDDYLIGEAPDGSKFTTILGAINTVLSFMIPGVLIGPSETVDLAFFIDDDIFFQTVRRMRHGAGLIVDIRKP
tara:strand:- start:63 stop:437 length:375 start_codon:yes stop_codon:yes gene_type:complete